MNQNGELLLECVECGERFFTYGEKRFYESKDLIIPRRCKKCREYQKERKTINAQGLYDEIINKWSVEARKEPQRYFCYIEEVGEITKGKRCYVTGRKGSGKTAIAQYMAEMNNFDTFSIRLSFKNFPFNILYPLENSSEYAAPNQYISMWKYIIFFSHMQKYE